MAAPRRVRPQKISTTPLYLFFGLVALLAVILGLLGQVNRKKLDEQAAAQERAEAERAPTATQPAGDPFADLPDEVGLGIGARGSRWATAFPRDPDPTGIEALKIWQDALNQSDAAWALADQARRALEADNQDRFESKGRAARIAFEKALEATDTWEEELVAQHGDRDEQVRKIIRTRSEWRDQVHFFIQRVGY